MRAQMRVVRMEAHLGDELRWFHLLQLLQEGAAAGLEEELRHSECADIILAERLWGACGS